MTDAFGTQALHGLHCPRLADALDRLGAIIGAMTDYLDDAYQFPTGRRLEFRIVVEPTVNARACIQGFGNNDQTTLEYFSKKLGECQITQVTHNVSTASATSTNDPSAQTQVQSLIAARGDAAILTAPLGLLADDAATGTSLSTTESWNTQVMRAPLLLPDELQRILKREDGTQLVLINGQPPMLMRRST